LKITNTLSRCFQNGFGDRLVQDAALERNAISGWQTATAKPLHHANETGRQ